MYFEKFPYIPYPFNGEFRVVKDITLNIRFKKDIIENISLYDEYDIEDGETPEIISEKLYNDPNLYWVLMLFNERYHYIEDFPLSQQALDDYIKSKYGEDKMYDQHILNGMPHYETESGLIVDAGVPFAKVISNMDFEIAENEKKRRIRIIDPRLMDQIVKEAADLIGGF